MKYWLFQGNPKYYRLGDALRDFEQMAWLMTRYANQIAVGDDVLIWQTAPQRSLRHRRDYRPTKGFG